MLSRSVSFTVSFSCAGRVYMLVARNACARLVPAGITQDQIDETRGQRERLMLKELTEKLDELAAGAGASGTLPNGDLAHAHPSAASLRRLAARLFDVEFVEKHNVAPVRPSPPPPPLTPHPSPSHPLHVPPRRALMSSTLSGFLVERDVTLPLRAFSPASFSSPVGAISSLFSALRLGLRLITVLLGCALASRNRTRFWGNESCDRRVSSVEANRSGRESRAPDGSIGSSRLASMARYRYQMAAEAARLQWRLRELRSSWCALGARLASRT